MISRKFGRLELISRRACAGLSQAKAGWTYLQRWAVTYRGFERSRSYRTTCAHVISGWDVVDTIHDILNRKESIGLRYRSGQAVSVLGRLGFVSLPRACLRFGGQQLIPTLTGCIKKFLLKIITPLISACRFGQFRIDPSSHNSSHHRLTRSEISNRSAKIIGMTFITTFASSVFGTQLEDEQLLGLWKTKDNCFVHIYQTQDDLLQGAAWGKGKESGELMLEVSTDRRFPWKRRTKNMGSAAEREADPKRQGRFIVDLFDRSILHSDTSPCYLKIGDVPQWKRVEISSIESKKVPEWYRPTLVGSINEKGSRIKKNQTTKLIQDNQPPSSQQVDEEVQEAGTIERQSDTPGCIDLVSIAVENKEFIEKGSKYRDLKQAIVQQNLVDAVQQVLGTEVRSHSGLALSSVDGADSERFNELVAQRANGLVRSYEVITEEIIGTGESKLLTVGLQVVVCVPDETTTFDMVAVGDFILSNGANSERLRSILIDLFPDNLAGYRLIPDHPQHAYHDIQIIGKVLRADKIDESYLMAQKRKSQNQAAAQMAGGLIGALVGIGDLGNLAANMNAGPAMRTYQVTVEVEVMVRRIMDQQVVSDRSVVTKAKLPEDIDFLAVRDELLSAAVEQATRSIYQKMFGITGTSANSQNKSNLLGSLFDSTGSSLPAGEQTEEELLNER